MKRFCVVTASCLALILAGCGSEVPGLVDDQQPAKAVKDEVEVLTADKLLDAAIEAHGGFDELEAASSWKSKTKGVYMGMPYESENLNKDGVVRMDITMGPDEKMSMVMGVEVCWMTSGPVVIECSKEEREANKVMVAMSQAMLLWPLKEGWKVELADKTDVDGKQCDALAIEHSESGAKGMLAFDPKTHLLAYADYSSKMMGQTVRFVSKPSGYKEFCGVQMAAEWQMTMNDRPYVEEHVVALECVPIDDAALSPPEQVADGHVVERTLGPFTQACTTMQGPYEGTGQAMGKLMGFLGQQQLMPVGPPMMVYLKAPPETKNPAEFETEVCFPVGAPPPAEPKVDGEFTIKAFPQTKLLAAYGFGPYDKKSAELAGVVMGELGKRKLKAAGPMCQLTYSDPLSIPPDKLVSAMMIPIADE